MCTEQGPILSFPGFIEYNSEFIDNIVIHDLNENDKDYIESTQKQKELEKTFPVIKRLGLGDGAISLSAEEHEAYTQYHELENFRGALVSLKYYWRGHADCLAYLRHISALQE